LNKDADNLRPFCIHPFGSLCLTLDQFCSPWICFPDVGSVWLTVLSVWLTVDQFDLFWSVWLTVYQFSSLCHCLL